MQSPALHQAYEAATQASKRWPPCVRLMLPARKALAAQPGRPELWAAAGLGLALQRELAGRFVRAGREVTEAIFALHDWFSPTPLAPRELALPALEPYRAWLAELAGGPQAALWRAVWMGWLEVHTERLTLHRYSDRRHRRAHVQKLLTAPVAAWSALCRSETLAPEQRSALTEAGELLLSYVDLCDAKRAATRGWNRIDVPEQATRMGGFYGLGDEARPPDAAALAESARELLAAFAAFDPATLGVYDPMLIAIFTQAQSRLERSLRRFVRSGHWQPWWRRWGKP